VKGNMATAVASIPTGKALAKAGVKKRISAPAVTISGGGITIQPRRKKLKFESTSDED